MTEAITFCCGPHKRGSQGTKDSNLFLLPPFDLLWYSPSAKPNRKLGELLVRAGLPGVGQDGEGC